MSEIVKNFIHSFDTDSDPSHKKVGLFFGSFNPIHVGHLIIANHMVSYSDLDELWFVVSPHNPHKEKATLLNENHRLSIVNEAIENNPKLKASNIEFKLPKPSFTVDSLAYLKEKHPTYQFALLMGEDNLRSFHKWKNYEVILSQYPILVYPRVQTIQEADKPKREGKITIDHQNIHLIDAPVMKISSSFIRKAIKNKMDVRYLLTEPVTRYIDEMNFYK